jgi:hypothetical protein
VTGKRTLIIVAGYFGLLSVLVLGVGLIWSRQAQSPRQPIAFSHRVHVAKVGLACNFCHYSVNKARRAGVPSVKKCMTCHAFIAVDRPEIKKLRSFWERKEPIPWVRIHKLPPHVYFSHKRHIKAGLECQACHGEVRAVDIPRRVSSLEMGWCVTCHRSEGASIDCLTCHK